MFRTIFCFILLLVAACGGATETGATGPVPITPEYVPSSIDNGGPIKGYHPTPETPEATDNEQFDQFYGQFFKMLFMLGIIIVFLLALTWFFKRFMNTRMEQINAASAIQIVERRAISTKTILYVLDISGRKVLVAESPNGVTAMTEFREGAEGTKET